MQKKCFNQKYGLEQAVLDGRKTMFRDFVPIGLYNQTDWKAVGEGDFEAVVDGEGYYHDIRDCGKYRIGEVVAIAQSYNNILNEYRENETLFASMKANLISLLLGKKGWGNKMFVEAKFMPHHIRITDIKVEQLQDISDEDCLNEGIDSSNAFEIGYGVDWVYQFPNDNRSYFTPREAFAALIDKVSGEGTWERNPWVFAYSFERVD